MPRNNGTGDITDDSLLPGAAFVIHLDDGDGVFEPDDDDAPPIQPSLVVGGFHVFTPTTPGRYWVVETSSPEGFDTAAPTLVDFLLADADENCLIADDQAFCVADDDPDGGYVVAVVSDSPTGGAGALTPPPTETVLPRATPTVTAPARRPGGDGCMIGSDAPATCHPLLAVAAILALRCARWTTRRKYRCSARSSR